VCGNSRTNSSSYFKINNNSCSFVHSEQSAMWNYQQLQL
jgi:hypothetical protein